MFRFHGNHLMNERVGRFMSHLAHGTNDDDDDDDGDGDADGGCVCIGLLSLVILKSMLYSTSVKARMKSRDPLWFPAKKY
jgi:hypothetical protein